MSNVHEMFLISHPLYESAVMFLQEALAQEDLSVSEFSSVLDTLQHVARDANVKV